MRTIIGGLVLVAGTAAAQLPPFPGTAEAQRQYQQRVAQAEQFRRDAELRHYQQQQRQWQIQQ
jgi:outer membrane biogenesis lipoprotein LolB